MFMGRVIGIGKALYHAMISDCNGRMPPFGGCFDIGINGCNRIHRAHRRMQMKFYPLDWSQIFTGRRCLHLGQIRRNHDQLGNLHKTVVFHFAACSDPFAVRQLSHDLQIFLSLGKHLDLQRIRKVRDTEGEQRIAVAQLFALKAEDGSLDCDFLFFILDFNDRYSLLLDFIPYLELDHFVRITFVFRLVRLAGHHHHFHQLPLLLLQLLLEFLIGIRFALILGNLQLNLQGEAEKFIVKFHNRAFDAFFTGQFERHGIVQAQHQRTVLQFLSGTRQPAINRRNLPLHPFQKKPPIFLHKLRSADFFII
ncbi:hypothetical protein D3C73_822700 [compost metagenome]